MKTYELLDAGSVLVDGGLVFFIAERDPSGGFIIIWSDSSGKMNYARSWASLVMNDRVSQKEIK